MRVAAAELMASANSGQPNHPCDVRFGRDIVAVLAEANEDGTEKETEMALPTLIGNDGRAAVIAFTGADTLRRWRQDARPVPVPGPRLWAAARTEADAVVVDSTAMEPEEVARLVVLLAKEGAARATTS